MKKKVILALFSLFLIVALVATPVFAKDPPDKGGGAQGVPFQELQDALDEAVSLLQDQIDALEHTVQGIVDETIATLQDHIDDLEDTVEELIADVDDEEERAKTAEAALQAGLNQEIDDRIADVDDEEAARINAGYLTEESDPVFVAWDRSTGISITESQISDLDHFTNADETDPLFSASAAAGITTEDITAWNAASGGGAGDGHSLDAADGNPVDALFVNNEGDVGIGTTNPSGLFEALTRQPSGPLLLDQQNVSKTKDTGGNSFWQEFTAGITGNLTGICLYPAIITKPAVLEIYGGGGPPQGTPLRTKNIDIHAHWWIEIDLDDPLPIEAGNKYTWRIYTSVPYYNFALWGSDDGFCFKTLVRARPSLVFTDNGNLGIGTTDPGNDRLDVRGRAYAEGGWQTNNADYAEWFEKEGEAQPGDIIGINLDTGKARKYQPGDRFLGICSSQSAFVGNRINETDEEMAEIYVLVGLLGQMDFNNAQVIIEGRIVETTDGGEIGILLSNGKVLIGR